MTLKTLDTLTPWWVKVLVPVILSALISLALTFGGTYFHNDRELVQRVSALEAHRTDDKADIVEIKTDVKAIYAKLLEWEGKK